MSIPKQPEPAKLVVGLFLKHKRLIYEAADDLIRCFGPVDLISPWFLFDYTGYYEAETGGPLYRRMFAFKESIRQSDLADLKLKSNELENRYACRGKRMINLDPGYMLPARFVLATGKNYSHRIYIGKGIYADLTLIYEKGAFHPLPWTYPDYQAENMQTFLKQVRSAYMADLKKRRSPLC